MKPNFKNIGLLDFAAIGGYVLASSLTFFAYSQVWAGDDGAGLPKPYETVSLLPRSFGREVEFAKILSGSDVTIYSKIFKTQKKGQWQEADRLIERLSNNVLLGHVMAQRYLHPRKYRSKYKELKSWMEAYSDLPEASQIYKLAIRRKPKNWAAPKRPAKILRTVKIARRELALKLPVKRLSSANRRKARSIKRQIKRALRRGHTLLAKRTLSASIAKKLLSTAEYDQYSAKLGQAYFSAGRDEYALKWAENAALRSGKYVPQAHWTSGLANWRLGHKKTAADHFAKAAELSRDNVWFHAASAFWAARAYLVTRQPEKVNGYLQIASKNGLTFYGLLARRVLGQDLGLNWAMPALDENTIRELTEISHGRRAMALLQIGDTQRAERELRNLALGADEDVAKGILALAARGNMASLAVRLDYQLHPHGGGYDGAAYPIPGFTPGEGFRIDRALIYALIRQESKFNPKAKSWAGARGLMQLMPGTARFVARSRRLRLKSYSDLFKPEINLTLGQKYIEILLKSKKINGDLFLMAAAWNGGPGNLNKWRKATEYMNDPLFFIESIPVRETRNFIEHVLSNLWIYRNRLGQKNPSLDAVAAGEWPQYKPQGQDRQEIAQANVTRN